MKTQIQCGADLYVSERRAWLARAQRGFRLRRSAGRILIALLPLFSWGGGCTPVTAAQEAPPSGVPVAIPRVLCSRANDTPDCRRVAARVAALLAKLPAAADWRWVLLDEPRWDAAKKMVGHKSDVAWSHLPSRSSYLRLKLFAAREDRKLREWLAHELAHILICGRDEACAIRATRSRLLLLGVLPHPATP